MKILHTADIHLGAKNIKLPLDKQTEIRNEQNLLITKLFQKAYQEDYDIVLICGDLFHAKNVQSKIVANFFKAVENFSRPVLYVKGNHDERFDFNITLPSNFIMLDNYNPFYRLDNVVFFGQVAPDIIEKYYDKTLKNILLLHGDINNRTSSDFVDINIYTSKYHFDYIALGHVHSSSKFDIAGVEAAYPGSLFSNGFDETGDKGYIEVIVEDNVKVNFVSYPSRHYCIVNCDITGLANYSDIINKIKNELKDNCSRDDLARVILSGYYTEDSEKYIHSIERDLKDSYYYFELVDNTKLKIDFEKIKNEDLSFQAEFLLLVENEEKDEELKNKICQLGIEALRGDDISIWY